MSVDAARPGSGRAQVRDEAADIPGFSKSSGAGHVVAPGGLLVVGGVGLQAAVEDAGQVDLVFDAIGGEILLQRSAALVRAGGTIVTISLPTNVRPTDGRSVFFVVEPDRNRLADLMERVRDGRLKPLVGAVHSLSEAAAALSPDSGARGKTIIRPFSH